MKTLEFKCIVFSLSPLFSAVQRKVYGSIPNHVSTIETIQEFFKVSIDIIKSI